MVNPRDNSQSPAGPRVLIANDQEWTARSLESILVAEGFEVTRAYTGNQALDLASRVRPDLVVLDFQLPDISGPEVCRALRQNPDFGWGLPIILTTAGSNTKARQAECLEAGAWDYQPQPFDGPLLLVKLRTFLRARAALVAAQAEAMLDARGLYTRRGMEIRLAELGSEARRTRGSLTCIALSAGSKDLADMAASAEAAGAAVSLAIKAMVRGSDLVARLAPLDFVVVAPGLPESLADRLVDRFREALPAGPSEDQPAIPLRARVRQLTNPEGLGDGLVQQIAATVEEASARQ